jgi:hypothetical protein
MQRTVKERVHKLRREMADISDANRRYIKSIYKRPVAAAEHEKRLQRLKEIGVELRLLTDWKAT